MAEARTILAFILLAGRRVKMLFRLILGAIIGGGLGLLLNLVSSRIMQGGFK